MKDLNMKGFVIAGCLPTGICSKKLAQNLRKAVRKVVVPNKLRRNHQFLCSIYIVGTLTHPDCDGF